MKNPYNPIIPEPEEGPDKADYKLAAFNLWFCLDGLAHRCDSVEGDRADGTRIDISAAIEFLEHFKWASKPYPEGKLITPLGDLVIPDETPCPRCGSNQTIGTGAGDKLEKENMECFDCGHEWEEK